VSAETPPSYALNAIHYTFVRMFGASFLSCDACIDVSRHLSNDVSINDATIELNCMLA